MTETNEIDEGQLPLTLDSADNLYSLDDYQQGALQAFWKSEATSVHLKESHEGHSSGHAHGHGEKPHSLASAFISAVINFLLMFGLCCAYGMIMFEDEVIAEHRGLGVKMNLGTALVTGLLCAYFSKVGVCIGGPDLNPVVFLGMFVVTIAEELAKKHGLKQDRRLLEVCGNLDEYSWGDSISDGAFGFVDELLTTGSFLDASRRLGGGACVAAGGSASSGSAAVSASVASAVASGISAAASASSGSSRRLAGGGSSMTWCTGAHLAANAATCAEYHEELRATVLFAVAFSSVLFAVLFILLGRLKLVKLVTLIPASIMEAFLSCIGYKVFKYALTFCGYKAITFIPAVCIGVPLYFMKAMHVGNPALVIPAMLLIPLGIYYLILYLVYKGGPDDFITAARADDYFFPYIEDVPFYKIWTDSVGNASKINFNAWIATLPDLAIMVVVVLLDCLLKISSTESKLPVKVDKEWEIQVYGGTNFLTAAFGSSVGYMQLKFNVINYGVVGNVTDRRAGAIYALICGLCFFWTVELFNYMPRFFIGVLLFFAGSGFVAENLWGSHKFLSVPEWIQVLSIVGTFIWTGQLTYAVVVGGLLCGASFIYRYAKVPCLDGPPMRGGDVMTCEHYDPYMQHIVSHMANSWLLVFNLKGFIFFASAVSMTGEIQRLLEEQERRDVPEFRRIKYIIFDCKTLDGLDASALKALLKLVGNATALNVKVLWSNADEDLKADLLRTGVLKNEEMYFENLAASVLHVEARILERAKCIQETWFKVHPIFREYGLHVRAIQSFEPFHSCMDTDSSRFGVPWQYVTRHQLEQYKTVLWKPGQLKSRIFLIHTGAVGIFKALPDKERAKSKEGFFSQPIMLFRHGAILNVWKILRNPTEYYAVALEDGEALSWNGADWRRMARQAPDMMEGVMTEAMRQLHSQQRIFMYSKPDKDNDVDGADAGAAVKRLAGSVASQQSLDQSSVPQSMQGIIRNLGMAKELRSFGCYEPLGDEQGLLPPLPSRVRKDVDVGFFTMLPKGADSLDLPTARKALLYAGIHGVCFHEAATSFSHGEFLAMANEAYFLRLSRAQEAKAVALFEEAKSTGGLGPDDTVKFMDVMGAIKKRVGEDMKEELVLGVADILFQIPGVMVLTKDHVIALMARLARRYELDWYALVAFREVLESDPFEPEADGSGVLARRLTAKQLVKAQPELTMQEAEEMIWAGNGATNEQLDFRLALQVLQTVYSESQKLPPPPAEPKPQAEQTAPAMSEQIRKLVVDLRSRATNHGGVVEDAIAEISRVRCTGMEKKAEEMSRVFIEYQKEDKPHIPETIGAKIHLFLDYPESSPAANCWSLAMGILIMLSVLTMVLQPLLYEQTPVEEFDKSVDKTVWFSIEAIFNVIFTIELIARFALAPALDNGKTYCTFLKDPMNICDFVAVAPFYLDLMFDSTDASLSDGWRLLRVLRLTRFMRVARMVRLGRLAHKSALFAPTAVVMTIIWFIYLKSRLAC